MSESKRGEVSMGAKKEKEKKLNWHLTELSSGTWSVGTTEDEAGHYPASEEEGRNAEAWVAPAEFVDDYLKKNDEQHTDQAVRDAIRAWMRQQGQLK